MLILFSASASQTRANMPGRFSRKMASCLVMCIGHEAIGGLGCGSSHSRRKGITRDANGKRESAGGETIQIRLDEKRLRAQSRTRERQRAESLQCHARLGRDFASSICPPHTFAHL